jgi:hypothetical protein
MWPVERYGILTQARHFYAEADSKNRLFVEQKVRSVQQRKAYLVCRFLYS